MKNGEIDSEKGIGNGKTHQNIALLGCLGFCSGLKEMNVNIFKNDLKK